MNHDRVSRQFRCRCGQQFQVQVPPGGARTKCPGCGTILSLKPPTAPQQAFPPVASSPSGVDLQQAAFQQPAFNHPPQQTFRPPVTPKAKKKATAIPKALIAAVLGVLLLAMIGGAAVAFGPMLLNQTRSANRPAVVTLPSKNSVTADEVSPLAVQFANDLNSAATRPSAGRIFRNKEAAARILDQLDIELAASERDSLLSRIGSSYPGTGLSAYHTLGLADTVQQRAAVVSLLKISEQNHTATALYRMMSANDIPSYFEVAFDRDNKNDLCAIDLYFYEAGIPTSAAIRFYLVWDLQDKSSSLKDEDWVKYGQQMDKVVYLFDTDPKAGLEAYEALPVTAQNNRFLMFSWARAASRTGKASDFEQAYNRLKKRYPNDPAVLVTALPWLASTAVEQDRYIEAIRALDEIIGGDAALHTLEAKTHIKSGDNDEAKAALSRAIASDPAYEEARTLLASLK